MAEKSVPPWVWGDLRRTLEAELPRLRPRFDEAKRKRLCDTLYEVYDEPEQRPHDKRHGRAVCAICCDFPFVTGMVFAHKEPGQSPIFEWIVGEAPPPGTGTIVCRGCMHRPFHLRDDDVAVARAAVAEMKEAGKYLPMFDSVVGPRHIRRTDDGVCAVCERRGSALRGVESVICWKCLSSARALFEMEMGRERDQAREVEERYERRVRDYMAELRRNGEEEARAAISVIAKRPASKEPAPRSVNDEAEAAIAFLEAEVERAVRYESTTHDLMGDRSRIGRVASLLVSPQRPGLDLLERLLVCVSMLRQLTALGLRFHDYTGDELINEIIGDYERVASHIDVGLADYMRMAEAGALLIVGGNAAMRAAAAAGIRNIIDSRHRYGAPFTSPPPFQYIEAENLYSMSQDCQEEIRRRMLVTPPWATIFGADDLDRFIRETPVRAKARFVTYFFMEGQEPLNLDVATVHVATKMPAMDRPRRFG